MFYTDQAETIEALVGLLTERKVQLYHACQLADFKSYLDLGGIPSRSLLERHGKAFTPFETDNSDKSRGLDKLVFANLSDSGTFFHYGAKTTPNAYGPIAFRIDPAALLEAETVAICLRSAGAADFSREKESLKSLSEIELLFKNPKNHQYCADIKVPSELKKVVTNLSHVHQDVGAPEMSCAISIELIPIKYVKRIIVDPLDVYGYNLPNLVEQESSTKDPKLADFVVNRSTKHRERYEELIKAVLAGLDTLPKLCRDTTTASPDLKTWANECAKNPKIVMMYSRFYKYLSAGTLSPMSQLPAKTKRIS